jgi:hypothetical protein
LQTPLDVFEKFHFLVASSLVGMQSIACHKHHVNEDGQKVLSKIPTLLKSSQFMNNNTLIKLVKIDQQDLPQTWVLNSPA